VAAARTLETWATPADKVEGEHRKVDPLSFLNGASACAEHAFPVWKGNQQQKMMATPSMASHLKGVI